MKGPQILSLSSIALVVVLVIALTTLLAPKEARAHPLGFESDLSEDETISVCNPQAIVPGRLAASIEQWNALTVPADGSAGGGPTFSEVTADGDGAFCEVRLQEAGGDHAPFYARLVFDLHPDRLQISARFDELPLEQKRATISHELGHAAGLDHPRANSETCLNSVMTTYGGCWSEGQERRANPGPHDAADLLAHWVETPIYPIANKCWTSEDADGDGVCDRFGPPVPAEGPAEESTSRAAGTHPPRTQETPPVVED
jgi:hypothetical protein